MYNQYDTEKFGKSIRSRLSQKNGGGIRAVSQPLGQNDAIMNRQSLQLQSQKIHLQGQDKMSVSYIFTMDDIAQQDPMVHSLANSRNQMTMSKKSVRFCETNSDSASSSLSKSKCKGQSILKHSRSDNLSSDSTTSHVGSISGGISAKASLKDKGIDCENKKYDNTIKLLTYQNKKFFDDLFPPGGASLFYSKKMAEKQSQIKWMRVEDIYRGRKIILYNHEDRNIVKSSQYQQLSYMSTCFNALGTSPRCIQRIFQNQTYSKLGIYYLRLNHQGIWKYLIVDDFIPVKQVGRNYIPIFMNVQASKSGYIQIWPLILQKAFAKIYSTYQSLFNDSVQNLMQQLTGVICQNIQLNLQARQNNELRIKNILMSQDNILIATQPQTTFSKQFSQQYYAITQNKRSIHTFFTQQTELKLLPTQKNKQPIYLLLQNFHMYFKQLKYYKIDDTNYSMGCIIKQNKNTISLRTFKIDTYINCTLSVSQKDKKYFRNNGYVYSWIRLILICKDLSGYRYINGIYNNNKIISINVNLNPGQYYILISGDWDKKVYDITLNYQGSLQIQIKRQQIIKYPKIIQQMCNDIAQRFGKFIQLNKNICSYQYIDRINGFIIQNFNNQIDKQIFLNRRYKINFVNFINVGNAKFVYDQHLNQKNIVKKNRVYQIQTFLKPQSNLTLVLMLIGGINQEDLSNFSFNGC